MPYDWNWCCFTGQLGHHCATAQYDIFRARSAQGIRHWARLPPEYKAAFLQPVTYLVLTASCLAVGTMQRANPYVLLFLRIAVRLRSYLADR